MAARCHAPSPDDSQGSASGCANEMTAETRKNPEDSTNAIFAKKDSRSWKNARPSSDGVPLLHAEDGRARPPEEPVSSEHYRSGAAPPAGP